MKFIILFLLLTCSLFAADIDGTWVYGTREFVIQGDTWSYNGNVIGPIIFLNEKKTKFILISYKNEYDHEKGRHLLYEKGKLYQISKKNQNKMCPRMKPTMIKKKY